MAAPGPFSTSVINVVSVQKTGSATFLWTFDQPMTITDPDDVEGPIMYDAMNTQQGCDFAVQTSANSITITSDSINGFVTGKPWKFLQPSAGLAQGGQVPNNQTGTIT